MSNHYKGISRLQIGLLRPCLAEAVWIVEIEDMELAGTAVDCLGFVGSIDFSIIVDKQLRVAL